MHNFPPPIAVFAYNRPAHLEACLAAIDRSQKMLSQRLPLFVFCDAPKNQEALPLVEKTRSIAQNHAGATAVLRSENLGFRNIVSGIQEMCDSFGRVIVVEDDVLISPDFLPYMCKSLEKYSENPKVFAISAHMYFNAQPKNPELFFIPYFFCWGWATWKRAWDHYTMQPEGWREFLKNKKERYHFDCLGTFSFSKMVEKTLLGKWNTWDAQWFYTIYKERGLVLSPYRSLTWNCGCGGGTHGDKTKDASIELGAREYWIHGDEKLEDYSKPRLSPDFAFPEDPVLDRKAIRFLGIAFLKERIRKEKRLLKKIRFFLRLYFLKATVLLIKKP